MAVNAGELFNHDRLVQNVPAEPFWINYEADANLFDDFLDDRLIKRIVSELRVRVISRPGLCS